MTTTHPILITAALAAGLTCWSTLGASFFFPQPLRDGVARHAKGARQAAQATAFFISAQNFFALSLSVTIGLGGFAATALTVVTVIALFLIFGEAVLHQVGAPAVGARHEFGNHSGKGIISLPLEPLPLLDRGFPRNPKLETRN